MPSTLVASTPRVSALMLADRLITLAQDADRAGYRDTASHLITMAHSVLDTPTRH